jgi:hemoglobin-like flavoprotein
MSINNGMISMGGEKYYLMPAMPAIEEKSETTKDIESVSRLAKKLEIQRKKNELFKALPKQIMPMVKTTRKSKFMNRKGKHPAHDDTSTSYNGPVFLRNATEEEDVQVFNVSLIQDATMAASVLDFTLPTSGVQSVADWTSIAAVFAEYRVLAMEVMFEPNVVYNTVTTASVGYPVIAWCTDRDQAATLGSYAVAASHESCVIKSSRYPHKQVYKMNGIEESVWTPVATTFAHGWIKGYATLAGVGTPTLGKLQTRFLLQVRGKV